MTCQDGKVNGAALRLKDGNAMSVSAIRLSKTDGTVPRTVTARGPSVLERIRNVGIIAHIDAGKTTVTERILYHTGRIHRMGEVHDGLATMDYLAEERERGITITSAATTCPWRGFRLNIIDTPGHIDFTAEVERSLRVLDGVVGIFCGVAGVEAQSETVWRQAALYGIPRLAFINKLDRIGADFGQAVDSIRTRLNVCPVPLQWPIVRDGELMGLIDLVEKVYHRFEQQGDEVLSHREEIPAEHSALAEKQLTFILEAAADYCDNLMARYLEGEDVSPEEIRHAVHEGTRSGNLVPVLGGTALKNRGIEQLLDAMAYYLPSPANRPIVEGRRPGDDEHLVHLDAVPGGTLCALAFKTIADRNGDLTFLRIYSGTLRRGQQVYNPRSGETERIGRIFRMHAAAREPLEEAPAGEIVAIMGLKDTVTGDTLCSRDDPIVLESMDFPEPVVTMSIAPRARGDRDRLAETLSRLAREDPSFHYHMDEETQEVIIAGMGELHLEVITNRITRDFGLGVVVGRPEVAYRQALARKVEIESRHVKQTGGHGQFAVINVRIGPSDGDGDFEFLEKVIGGRVPKDYFRSIERGFADAVAEGGELRYPFVNVSVELFDGQYHEVDSSEMAFSLAARQAFQLGLRAAGTILMEPVVRFEIRIPEEFLGEVLGDLNTRRAAIESMDLERGTRVLRGKIPLAETFRYATRLRSLTQGRGNHSLEPCEFARVPASIAEKVAAERRERLAGR